MLASYRILSEPHEALATMIVVAEYPNPRSFLLLGGVGVGLRVGETEIVREAMV